MWFSHQAETGKDFGDVEVGALPLLGPRYSRRRSGCIHIRRRTTRLLSATPMLVDMPPETVVLQALATKFQIELRSTESAPLVFGSDKVAGFRSEFRSNLRPVRRRFHGKPETSRISVATHFCRPQKKRPSRGRQAALAFAESVQPLRNTHVFHHDIPMCRGRYTVTPRLFGGR